MLNLGWPQVGEVDLAFGGMPKKMAVSSLLHGLKNTTSGCRKRHDLSNRLPTLESSLTHWRFRMFWIAILGLAFSCMLIKLGFLFATASILSLVVKLLIFAIFTGLISAAWFWLRRRSVASHVHN
jgi:hypothetical protein